MGNSGKAQSTHGYVYAFYRKKSGWLKVGMTDKPDQEACRGRMLDYAKAHQLPRDGWAFVCAIPVRKPVELEKRLHHGMRHLHVANGSAVELFSCSQELFATFLMQHEDLLDLKSVSPNDKVRQVQEQRRRREALERLKREAEERARQQAKGEMERRLAENEAAEREYEQRSQNWRALAAPYQNKKYELDGADAKRWCCKVGCIGFASYCAYQLIFHGSGAIHWVVALIALFCAIQWRDAYERVEELQKELKQIPPPPPGPQLDLPYPELKRR